jgi:hypothetical protein
VPIISGEGPGFDPIYDIDDRVITSLGCRRCSPPLPAQQFISPSHSRATTLLGCKLVAIVSSISMAHQSPWVTPLLPPLEPDEFLFDVLESPFNSTYFPLPTLSSHSPGHFNVPPAHFGGDYTAGAVIDFIDTVGFDDIPWPITTPFDDGNVNPQNSPSPAGPTNTAGALPFHSASHGTLSGAFEAVRLEFEHKVLSLLGTPPGTAGDLKIECLDAQQEDTLTRISRERGLAIRFEPSPYPNRPRVAIIPRHASHPGPGPPASLAELYQPQTVTASRVHVNQSGSLQAPLSLSWSAPPEQPLLFSDPQGNRETALSASNRVPLPLPQDTPKFNHIRSIKNRFLGRPKTQGRINTKGACYPCRLTRKKVRIV